MNEPSVDKVIGHTQLAYFEKWLCHLSAIAIAIMMFIVVFAIGMRYFVGHPLSWTYEIIGTYVMVCAFFPAISDGLRLHSHIAIDVFQSRFPRRFLHFGLTIGYFLSMILMFLITWQGWGRLVSSWKGGDIISITIPWPTWPTYMLLCVGCLCISLRCMIRTIAHLKSLVTGMEYAAIPNLATDVENAIEEGSL